MSEKNKSKKIAADGRRANNNRRAPLAVRFLRALARIKTEPIHSRAADAARETKEKLMDANCRDC